MNPNPLALLNHFTVPCSTTRLSCLATSSTKEPPSYLGPTTRLEPFPVGRSCRRGKACDALQGRARRNSTGLGGKERDRIDKNGHRTESTDEAKLWETNAVL